MGLRFALAREREIYFKSHISWWEHSSHFRLIGRGVPSVSVVTQLVYKFLCLASSKENPRSKSWLLGFKQQARHPLFEAGAEIS